jgi:hypothetical protein
MKTMSTPKNQENKANDGWDEAIDEAKERIRSLLISIAVFKHKKAAGESFPSVTQS